MTDQTKKLSAEPVAWRIDYDNGGTHSVHSDAYAARRLHKDGGFKTPLIELFEHPQPTIPPAVREAIELEIARSEQRATVEAFNYIRPIQIPASVKTLRDWLEQNP